ncbi:hypothetical protein PAALTS15_12232 [Paenibacillus alvei TS-15]|uniref:Uncharacterized protein n=1 Tax=Paenibacillus alvei TS-15 TaxID=1117108 RepID=S9TXH4_PAEAL|nr:hypothetical protein PAALTS15_12232 [Paenibacillus alvei TS-15]
MDTRSIVYLISIVLSVHFYPAYTLPFNAIISMLNHTVRSMTFLQNEIMKRILSLSIFEAPTA